MENKIRVHTVSVEVNTAGYACIMIHGVANDKTAVSFAFRKSEDKLIAMIENRDFVFPWVERMKQLNSAILEK